MAEEICRRFRFSNEDTAQIIALVANHLRFKDVPQMKPATLKRFVRLDRFEEHLELHRLDCSSSHGHLDNYDFVRRFLAETPRGGGASGPPADRGRLDRTWLPAGPTVQGDTGSCRGGPAQRHHSRLGKRLWSWFGLIWRSH